ncbi:DUF4136 domain-containing protein [Rhodoferax sp.]|uniref:DUF4136 domain-containing protein n=1 Tax=Rhodoferax sp. TaxID=50421 RepID=UPI002ACD264A|nr:DUF4136 domain-containing protein [Rhodoferax sp.]MDZ7920407.1 DUF4136 domain-containing protein [Rhodoferax sp.]
MALHSWFRHALLVLAAAALTGCALPRMIDSDVQSFVGNAPALSGASYRFERLPSQAQNSDQDQIEALAQEALERIGLQRNDDAPRYLVQVNVSVDGMRNPHYRPSRPRLVVGANGVVYEEWPWTMDVEVPWYRHRVQVLLRDSANGQLAYETAAVFDGPWRDTLNLLPPMLEAALKDYPLPGKRRVVVELPVAGAR